jgi:uncharacterized protein YecE (DUF72 family)
MTDSQVSQFVRLGTSSFSSEDWVGPFYPPGTKPAEFLSYYASKFDTVEVDSTYYAIPAAKVVDGWVEKTPESFLISAKFPRSIVHGGNAATPNADLILQPDKTYKGRDQFLKVISRLGPRMGPLILQFPYFSKKVFSSPNPFFERLERFLTDLPKGFQYGVEIRNKTWLKSDFAEMCRAHRVALVLVDHAWMPHGDEIEKLFDPITTDFAYIRLLGDRQQIEEITKTWEKEVIDRGENLERWSHFLVRLAVRQIPTLVYINNHFAGHAPATLRRLQELLSQQNSV